MSDDDERVKDALKQFIQTQSATIAALNDGCQALVVQLREIEHDLRVTEVERDYWRKRAED